MGAIQTASIQLYCTYTYNNTLSIIAMARMYYYAHSHNPWHHRLIITKVNFLSFHSLWIFEHGLITRLCKNLRSQVKILPPPPKKKKLQYPRLTLNVPEELHLYGLCVYYVVHICDFGTLRVKTGLVQEFLHLGNLCKTKFLVTFDVFRGSESISMNCMNFLSFHSLRIFKHGLIKIIWQSAGSVQGEQRFNPFRTGPYTGYLGWSVWRM